MKFNKVITLVFMLLFVFSVSFSSMVFATDSVSIESFTDIPINHWGSPAINWALEQGMVGGYEDGTFRPDRKLTEAEFATMFAKYASNTIKDEFNTSTLGEHWSKYYYEALDDFQLPFRGYSNSQIKDADVTRGQIAMIVAANYGFNLTQKQAVYFMYENELSLGLQTGVMTYESYGYDQALTRAQAVQFMKNISGMGLKQMTFKGNLSTKGKQTAEKEIKGVVGVPVDNSILVDFNDFGMPAPVGSGITTKVVGGKVVVDMVKITEPFKVDGLNGKFINYFDFDSNVDIDAGPINNSIMLYKGVELPVGGQTLFPESMDVGGIIGLEYNADEGKGAGRFTDKAAFVNLLDNLSYLNASTGQIAKAKEMVNTWGGETATKDTIYLVVNSKKKDNNMVIMYGDGNVNIFMFEGFGTSDGLGTAITVD